MSGWGEPSAETVTRDATLRMLEGIQHRHTILVEKLGSCATNSERARIQRSIDAYVPEMQWCHTELARLAIRAQDPTGNDATTIVAMPSQLDYDSAPETAII